MIKQHLKIANRTSLLAINQTNKVVSALKCHYPGITVTLIPVKTKGDQDQLTSLQDLGQIGIFTKALDDSILSGESDFGVHSFKDYPTILPKGLQVLAVLPRDGYLDAFIPGNGDLNFDKELILLSGSPRRKAQWLRKYPKHQFRGLRGNMATRVAKIKDSDGGIVSAPALDRLGIIPSRMKLLNWMTPAPAQGVIVVIGREDKQLSELFSVINHEETYRQSFVERDFMASVEAGCASPLGALVRNNGKNWSFEGVLLSHDGQNESKIKKIIKPNDWEFCGKYLAKELLENGGKQIMEKIKLDEPHDVLCLKQVTSQDRKKALSSNIKLNDLEVLDLEPQPFNIHSSSYFIVGSSFGAQQLSPRTSQLPEQGFCIGTKSKEILIESGYSGIIECFSTSKKLIDFIKFKELKSITYYGAKNTSEEWSSFKIKHTVTYVNTPKFPKIHRELWDAIAAFSPLGLDSLMHFNQIKTATPIVAIGPATAKAAKTYGFTNVTFAKTSKFVEVLELIQQIKK